MNKRGITPIIATILLLMMAVAAAAASFYWLVKIQGQMQGGAEQYEEKSFERMASKVNWIDAKYNGSGTHPQHGNLTLYIQNVGTTTIPLDAGSTDPTTSIIIKDKNQDVICSEKLDGSGSAPKCTSGCGGNLDPNALAKLIIKLNGTGSSCNSIGSGTYADDALFYITLYFSGKATTAGTFEK